MRKRKVEAQLLQRKRINRIYTERIYDHAYMVMPILDREPNYGDPAKWSCPVYVLNYITCVFTLHFYSLTLNSEH